MNRYILILLLFSFTSVMMAQEERKHIRDGYKEYMNENYSQAEVDFRKAEEVSNNNYIARYNTAAALYQQEKLEDAGEEFMQLFAETTDKNDQAKILHNVGNVMMKGEKYQEAADAYKRSLRLNPSDEDTRYNLAYALKKLEEQQQQQQNQDQQEQEQDQQEQDGEDQQQNQDQQQEQQEENDEERQEQQQQQENQEQDEQQENQQQQQENQQMNQDEAERLLNAILQKEKDVKEKVDKKKAAAAKVKTEKDW